MFRLTVTQLRVAIVVGNLAITLVVGALPIYRTFSPHEPYRQEDLDRVLKTTDINDLRSPPQTGSTGPDNVVRVAGIGRMFAVDPAPPPAPEPTVTEPAVDEVADGDPEELDPGPLDETHTYVGGMYVSYISETNLGRVERKQEETTSPNTRTVRARIRRVTSVRSARARAVRKTADENSKILRVYERWVVDEEEGPAVWIVRITPDELVYEVEGDYGKQYSLKRERNDIYVVHGDENIVITPKTEEPKNGAEGAEGAENGEEEEKKQFFHVGGYPLTLEQKYLNRKSDFPQPYSKDSASESTSTSPVGGPRTTSRTTRPPRPTAQQLRELKQATENIPAGQRKKIDDVMKKAAERRTLKPQR